MSDDDLIFIGTLLFFFIAWLVGTVLSAPKGD